MSKTELSKLKSPYRPLTRHNSNEDEFKVPLPPKITTQKVIKKASHKSNAERNEKSAERM